MRIKELEKEKKYNDSWKCLSKVISPNEEVMLTIPGVMSILMFTSKSCTEKRSVGVGVDAEVSVMSAELDSVDGSVTVSDGSGPAGAVSTC